MATSRRARRVNPTPDLDAPPSTSSDTSVVPTHDLSLHNDNPPPGMDSKRFILFSRNWLQLQTFVAQGLLLPINKGDFEDKYGTFSDEDLITGAAASMKDVQDLSIQFGDPTTIKEKIQHDGNYLSGSKPPEEVYGHIVWLATKIENAADNFNYSMKFLQKMLDGDDYTDEKKQENLKEILVGDGGISSTADDMATKCGALISKLTTFESHFDTASAGLKEYTDEGTSQLIQEIQSIIAGYDKALNGPPDPGLIQQAKSAHDSWRDYTIAAVASAVAITWFTAGLMAPIAAGAGGLLGAEAQRYMDKYNKFSSDINTDKADTKKKVRLSIDLGAYSILMPKIKDAITQFKSDIQLIEGTWVDLSANLNSLADQASVEKISTYSGINQIGKIDAAQKGWGKISERASVFTTNSLVSIEPSPGFGNEAPSHFTAA